MYQIRKITKAYHGLPLHIRWLIRILLFMLIIGCQLTMIKQNSGSYTSPSNEKKR